jgi:hypothetical protein
MAISTSSSSAETAGGVREEIGTTGRVSPEGSSPVSPDEPPAPVGCGEGMSPAVEEEDEFKEDKLRRVFIL